MKKALVRFVFRPGTTVRIIRGPLKGCRYVVNERTGWAPIYGGWEPEAQEAYRRFVRPDSVVYDLGANTGIHSLLFSRLVGDRGKVFAFEPLPENVRELETTKALNRADNIHVVPIAVSNRRGAASFTLGAHAKTGGLSVRDEDTADSISVTVDSLDHLIEDGMDPPDFVKIDIEGGEADALEGVSRYLRRSSPTFFIDLHTPEQDVRVGRFLQLHGYQVFRLQRVRRGPLLSPIQKLDRGWPDPEGVWGTIVAAKAEVGAMVSLARSTTDQ